MFFCSLLYSEVVTRPIRDEKYRREHREEAD